MDNACLNQLECLDSPDQTLNYFVLTCSLVQGFDPFIHVQFIYETIFEVHIAFFQVFW